MRKILQYRRALSEAFFRRLARAVREVGEGHYDTTFWFPDGRRPGNIVEEAVARLRRKARPGRRCVGSEWWLGRLPRGRGLPLHFDRDKSLHRRTGQVVHPLRASILYLNRCDAGPTVILEQTLGPDGRSLAPPEAKRGATVAPVPNAYVVFRGDLRHGVMADPSWKGDATSARGPAYRLTLLVNFWDRRPEPPVCREYDGRVYGSLQRKP